MNNGVATWQNSLKFSIMPKEHTTPALHLLSWPLIRDLVPKGRYEPVNLAQIEMDREPLDLSNPKKLDLTHADRYVAAYFKGVNVWYACVNPFSWTSLYRRARAHEFRQGGESCVALLVLALGQASLAGSISLQPRDREPPGLNYFAWAWALLPNLFVRTTLLSTQCHVLASAYLLYIVRPLEAWNMLSSASSKLQLLLCRPPKDISTNDIVASKRLYWNTLLFER